jgi:peroxiredoxin
MAQTPSVMSALGGPAPAFDLPDVRTGRRVTLEDFSEAPALLVAFICRHCPFVVHIQEELARIGRDLLAQGGAMVAISANDAENYPDDAPERLAEQARRLDFAFPYLYDESQEVARAYGAACTPDFFLYGPARTLVYRGRMDASRPGNDVPVTGDELRAAIEAILHGRTPAPDQHPSIGCNIKWKPGR